MKIWNSTRKVIVSRTEVIDFMRTFPCSGLRERAYWFEFDENGDLIDTDIPEHDDGPGAVALSQDAFAFLESSQA